MRSKSIFYLFILLSFSIILIGCTNKKEPYDNGPENIFPRIGLWKLSGIDNIKREYNADMVIKNIHNENFDGYFDWYRVESSEFIGREYFSGYFINDSNKIVLNGNKVENNVSTLALATYEANITKKKNIFYNGKWYGGGGVPSNNWKATWINK